MHEILRHLPKGSYVLDLGSHSGSFDTSAYPIFTIGVDLEYPQKLLIANFVQADAASLPLKRESFDAAICNHSLEHVQDLDATLRELGRVLKTGGALYVAVPDPTTLTDILYRWLARWGGHLNAFSLPDPLISKIQSHTGLSHIGTRVLCTSLSFLNPKNRTTRAPRKLILLGGGREPVLLFLNYFFRLCDRLFGTRMCVYGWALYFGAVHEEMRSEPWINVCIRCGAGHSSDWLLSSGAVWRKYLFFRFYLCPNCGAKNVFYRDGGYSNLR